MAKEPIATTVKKIFNAEGLDDKLFMEMIRRRRKFACKPCWELKYCPYGAIVENYPMPPVELAGMEKLIAFNRKIVETGRYNGEDMPPEVIAESRANIDSFRPEDHTGKFPGEVMEMGCKVFGHMCPVFFESEDVSETTTNRQRGRYIPFKTKMRVVRRDNHTCQRCGKHLLDDEVEFDHIFPAAKGGSTEEHNIRLTCYDCNREKTDQIEI